MKVNVPYRDLLSRISGPVERDSAGWIWLRNDPVSPVIVEKWKSLGLIEGEKQIKLTQKAKNALES